MAGVLKVRDGFRDLGLCDLEELARIDAAAYAFPWPAAVFRDCMQAGYCCRAWEEGGQVAAYGVMMLGAGEGHLLNLCVRPSRQRQGVGRRMLEHLVDRARAAGAETLFLEVRRSNHGALELYRSAGFCEVTVRRAYYPARDGHEDAVVMARALHR